MPPRSSELLSILVPTYNEAGTVATVVRRLLTIDLPIPREVIVVDDGSLDGTRQALEGLLDEGDALTIVRHERNRGKGAAIRTGIARARGSIVAIQDADLELDPAQIASLVEPILRGEAVAVFGSRFLRPSPGVPLLTTVANRVLTALTNLLYGSSLTDVQTCYKVLRTDVARRLDLRADRFDIEPEIAARLLLSGIAIVERPIAFTPRSRATGKKVRWRDGIGAVRMLARHRFRAVRRPAGQPSSDPD